MSAIHQQLNQINMKINNPTKPCEFCRGLEHYSRECQVGNPFVQIEQANYLNFQSVQANLYGTHTHTTIIPIGIQHILISLGVILTMHIKCQTKICNDITTL